MKIEAKVGEQHQMCQKCFVVPCEIIYPVRGVGIVAPQPVIVVPSRIIYPVREMAIVALQDILDIRSQYLIT